MLAQIKDLFNKLSNYPRLRVSLIIGLVVVCFVVLMNLLTPKHNQIAPSSVQPVTANPTQQGTPVSSTAANQYNQLENTAQSQQVQQAAATGASVFESPFSNEAQNQTTGQTSTPAPASSPPPASAATPPAAATPAPPSVPSATDAENAQLQNQLNQLQQQLASQQENAQENAVSQLTSNMNSSLSSLSSGWAIPTAATVQAAAPAASATPSTTSTPGAVIIKAGTIYFGVIATALDSDQPGTPVMATIVNGPYQGARLLGAFQAENEALVVQFNIMSLPNMATTIPINAYALDANTANNAIATSVNNHYLLRYGMLFASGFLQGFGNAYQSYSYTCPPSATNCTLINSTGTPNNTVTTKTATYQGFGQVGTNLGQAASNVFNTPPTIKVAQGTGIGVLFMNDVTLSTNQ